MIVGRNSHRRDHEVTRRSGCNGGRESEDWRGIKSEEEEGAGE
jgi:hypothetical protein